MEPSSHKQALMVLEWHTAMQLKHDSLMKNNTRTLVPYPSDKKLFRCKRVFKTKENPNGTINKHKSRLVDNDLH